MIELQRRVPPCWPLLFLPVGDVSADVGRAGGTMVQVLDDIIARGASPSMIRIVTVVCTPTALKKLSEGYPGATFSCSTLRLTTVLLSVAAYPQWSIHSRYC